MSDPEEYERQFCGAASDIWRLDASTDYFGDRGSSERIKEVSKLDTVKVLCVLRDPVERMYSEYRHSLRDNSEVLSFQDSLNAEEERIAKGYQPLFFHKSRSEYWTHIARWRASFGDENFLMLSYSEFGEHAALEKKICEFLNLPTEDIGTIPTLNASRIVPRTNSLLNSIKKNVKTTLGRLRKQPTVAYPAFTSEDQHYAFSLIKEEVERCMADPKIPTDDWALCARLLSEASQPNENVADS